MRVVFVRNVEQALLEGLDLLERQHIKTDSRNGAVMVAPCPVVTCYVRPTERVMLNPVRDCNPFFHMMEALWMLNGQNDVATPTQFNSTFGQFSDDGKVFNGAYGHRWREHFLRDQLVEVIQMLRDNPQDRRVVLGMWDPEEDLGSKSKDIPCNTHIYFDAYDGFLNMTVCNRSNDIWWGAYGANAVHMSMLMEVVAAGAGLPMGTYRQFSNNYHLYTEVVTAEKRSAARAAARTDYAQAAVEPYPVVNCAVESWLEELGEFMLNYSSGTYRDPFFEGVAKPMHAAWLLRTKADVDGALAACDRIAASDWKLACTEWIKRRIK